MRVIQTCFIMIEYISKVKDGVYRVELENGPVDIFVRRKKDWRTIDKLIQDIKGGIHVIDGQTFIATHVQWDVFDIAKVLRDYDEKAANEWCAREFGGLRGLIDLALRNINSQFYGVAGDLLNEIEELSFTTDKLPVVAFAVFDSEEECDDFLAGDEKEE